MKKKNQDNDFYPRRGPETDLFDDGPVRKHSPKIEDEEEFREYYDEAEDLLLGDEKLFEEPEELTAEEDEEIIVESEVQVKVVTPEAEEIYLAEEEIELPTIDAATELNHPAEIAARYLKEHGKGPIGGSDSQILKDLRKMVFSVPLLPQKEVTALFKDLDAQLNPAVYRIMASSGEAFGEVAQIVVKVAAGNTYGKNIYEKEDVPAEEKGLRTSYKELFKDHEISFLINAHQLMRVYAEYQASGEIPKVQSISDAMQKCCFIRGVYEEVLENFVTKTRDYPTLHWKAVKLKDTEKVNEYAQVVEAIALLDEALKLNKLAYSVSREALKVYEYYKKVRSTVIAPYLRSVYSAAKKTARNAHQMLDNFQNGSIGLMRAVSCYSTYRPASFASVAKWWIKQMMLLSIKEDANFVKLPVSTWQAYTQLEKVRAKLSLSEDRLEDIAAAAKMPLKKAQSVYHTVKIAQVYSLNRTYDSDEKLTLEDIVTDNHDPENDVVELIREYCDKADLTREERRVLALKHGMPDLLTDAQIKTSDLIREALVQNLALLGYNFKFS